MNATQVLLLNQFAALLLPRRRAPDVLTLAADLAFTEALHVVDRGNLFNVLVLSRMVRQRTERVVEVLNRISISRAFTCCQMEAMLAELDACRGPMLVSVFPPRQAEKCLFLMDILLQSIDHV
jgi:hypothetical protein